mmetsp:Transcript_2486/g.2359  ORF Transcript_2486/g.2359 Transcript_2486/m.2359 type:complete len:80 (-) Transcript_2486:742-981(-)
MRNIKSYLFFKSIHTEHSQEVQYEKERSHGCDDPANDPEDPNELYNEELKVARVSAPTVEPSKMLEISIYRQGTIWFSK